MTESQYQRNMLDSIILHTLTGKDPMDKPVAPNGTNWLTTYIV